MGDAVGAARYIRVGSSNGGAPMGLNGLALSLDEGKREIK